MKNHYQLMFKGAGSFPLSPNPNHKYELATNYTDENDQMNIIVRCIGKLAEHDVSFMSQVSRKRAVVKYSECFDSMNFLNETFSNKLTEEERQVLIELLQFNPDKRKSAAEILALPIFDQVRKPELEITAASKFYLEIDEPEKFDY